MTKKVRSHDEAVRLARYRDEFEHSSVKGVWKTVWMKNKESDFERFGRVYIIYSYGSHFPMYVYDEVTQRWLGNSDKYSRTTSSHQSKYRPSEVAKWFDTTALRDIVGLGYLGYITNRMENGLPE
jgi:hypothetical protein